MTDNNEINLPAISVENVGKTFQLYANARQMVAHELGLRNLGFKKREPIPKFSALDDVSFELERGERIGLIGRNGAGKTTLLKLLTGSLTPTRGTLAVNGTLQALMAAGIGFHPEFTGRQNIDATLQYYGLHGKAYQAAMDDVVSFVELGKYLDQPFNTYSLGMQARTQFAVATAVQPDIVLIDEILGAGDGYFAAKSLERMKRLIGNGCTMILVSHSGQTIEMFCKRVIWLRDGKIYRDGDAKAVLAEYEQEMDMLVQAGAGVRTAAEEDRDAFALPNRLRTDFVRHHVLAAEPVGSAVAPEVAAEFSGGEVFRLAGAPGIRIANVRPRVDGERDRRLHVGDNIDISVDLNATVPGEKDLRLSLLVYTLSGERLAKAQNCIRVDFPRGLTATVQGKIGPLQLGSGQFVVSVLVENAALPEQSEEARYDLVSQCLAFSYAPTAETDPPLVHFAGWVRHGDAEPVRVLLAEEI